MMNFFGKREDESRGTVPIELFADFPIQLSPDDYPNSAWGELSQSYTRLWEYYQGIVLNERVEGVDSPLKYPAQVNLVKPAVYNHAALLLGQYDDQIVKFGLRGSLGIEDSVITDTTELMNKLWSINNGDMKMIEQAIFQQIFGGFWFGIKWNHRKKYPISYVTIDPRNVFPTWDGDDYDRIVAIDVNTQIPKPLAEARYGINASNKTEYVQLHEHWNETDYYVEIDGKIAKWPNGEKMSGKNPFICPIMGRPIVPFSYAPRVRVGNFNGESLVPSVMGTQDEFNRLMGHLSDGINDAMHQKPWVRNRAKGATGLHNNPNEWLDLGMTQVNGKGEPEVGRLEGADIAPAVTEYVTKQLLSIARMAHFMPNVGYGDTDSSVRSAITLHYMMWPAMNMGKMARINSSVALKDLNYKALVMGFSKKELQTDFSVSEEMIDAVIVGHKTNWPQMMPQDRSDLVNEIVQRISSGTISIQRAIELLEGSDMTEEEMARIEEDGQVKMDKQMEQMKMQAELAPKPAPGQPAKPGQPPAAASKPKDTSTQAQAKGGRAKGKGK